VTRNYLSLTLRLEPGEKQPLLETAVDAATAVGNGYTESKWVAEQVLAKAAELTSLEPLVVRVGQLCGGVNGAWNTHEWVAALVQSANVVGCIPTDPRVCLFASVASTLLTVPFIYKGRFLDPGPHLRCGNRGFSPR
jgi:thioester reductase-like protein